MPNMPIEPVIVLLKPDFISICRNPITSEAATLPIEAIIFIPFSLAATNSCLINSEANTLPPESILNTIALIFLFSWASLIN